MKSARVIELIDEKRAPPGDVFTLHVPVDAYVAIYGDSVYSSMPGDKAERPSDLRQPYTDNFSSSIDGDGVMLTLDFRDAKMFMKSLRAGDITLDKS